MDLFLKVVPVAVYDRIHHRFPHGHADLVQVFFFETTLLGNLKYQILSGIDTFERGVHGRFHTSSSAALIIWHIVHETAAQ
jgi:hypothetical protein